VESYLEHKGESFSQRFDANSYLLMNKALDYFDLAREYGNDPVRAFKRAKASFFVMSFTSDWRFAPERSREITQALVHARKRVSYVEIVTQHGHDAFLLPDKRTQYSLRAYMKRVARGHS
jgi:homoserine O-acetyltransferase